MKHENNQTVMIAIPTSHIEKWPDIRATLDDVFAFAKQTYPELPAPSIKLPTAEFAKKAKDEIDETKLNKNRYTVIVFDQLFGAENLSDAFANVIDQFAEVAGDALEKFAEVRTSKRSYISKHRSGIHHVSNHLPTKKTGSGWWISANISERQLKNALFELCKLCGLDWHQDVKFKRHW